MPNQDFIRQPSSPSKKGGNKDYAMIPQNNALNDASRVNSNNNIKHLPLELSESSYGNVTLRYAGNKIGVAESQLSEYIRLKFNEMPNHEKNRTLFISLDTYMTDRGLNNKKSAKRTLQKLTRKVSNIQIYYTGGDAKRSWDKPFGIMNMIDKVEWQSGGVLIQLTTSFHDYLVKNTMVMPYALSLLRLNPRTQKTEYYIGLWLLNNKRYNSENKKRADVVSVKTLLTKCPNLPSHAKVKKGNGNTYTRIIKPVLDAVEYLTATLGLFKDYRFFGSDGQQLHYDEGLTYDTFIHATLKVVWTNYPEDELKKIVSKKVEHRKKPHNKANKNRRK